MNQQKIGNYRWVICGLLLFAVTINSMDKFVISYLKSYFCSPDGFAWTNTQFSYVTSSFTAVWALSTIFAGAIIDKIGSRLGMGLAVTIWSAFEILNAFAGRLVVMHCITRSLLGVGEAGCFPGALKTTAEWFPKKERAFATGIFNAGSSVGAMSAALFVPWCLWHYGPALGWRLSLIYTGAMGFIWLIFWWLLGGTPAKLRGNRLSETEYAHIHADDTAGAGAVETTTKGGFIAAVLVWLRLLTFRQTWAFFFAKFMTDGIWWFYLFWLPDFLEKQFNLTVQQAGRLAFIVWGVAIFGSVLGGRVPMLFMNRGWHVFKARITSMFMFALLPLLVLFVQYIAHHRESFGGGALAIVIVLISIAVAAHQMFSANLFTIPSDLFPKKTIASVSGIGIAAGGLGGVLIQMLVGRLTDHYKLLGNEQTAYTIMFVIAALAYLCAWTIVKILVPRFKPVTDL